MASQPVMSAVEMMFGMLRYERGTGPGSDAKRFVRLTHVQRLAIRLGEHRDGANAELLARAIDP